MWYFLKALLSNYNFGNPPVCPNNTKEGLNSHRKKKNIFRRDCFWKLSSFFFLQFSTLQSVLYKKLEFDTEEALLVDI
jgi:hypothetical protein